jgi:hypothetical protein
MKGRSKAREWKRRDKLEIRNREIRKSGRTDLTFLFLINFAVNRKQMKKRLLIYFLIFYYLFLIPYSSLAQCSICTKTAQQLGDGPAAGLNAGILYLAFAPFIIVGYIGYKWWQKNKD